MENKQLTRAQKRYIDRANKHANGTFGKLVDQYMETFFDYPPDSDEVKNKEKEVIVKWNLYCRLRQLNPEVIDNMDKYIKGVKEKYEQANNHKIE